MTDGTPARHERAAGHDDGAAPAAGAAGAAGGADGPARRSRGAHRSRTADLTGRVEALERALELGGDRLAPRVRTGVADAVAGVRARLALGVDHTLVAFVGGTGSGKSSLFNATCGLPFAEVGARRPTTSAVTACVWGPTGGPLLDWLGVTGDHRFERETVLDADAEADLRGLVLLDLPDHDSVAEAHRAVVDRLLPMVDLLVWVVDPQKYADDALHSGYLRGLVGREAAMVVVLNQVDTVPTQVHDRLVADLSRLLADDGLVGVPVLATSAVTGDGIGDLRAVLARVVAGPSVAAVRAGAELAAAARLLGGDVGAGEPAELPVDDAVDGLSRAAGVPATADAVAAAVRGGGAPVRPLAGVQAAGPELVRSRWLADVGSGLPPAWRASLAQRVAPAEDLRRATERALADVPVVARRSGAATTLTALAVLAAVAAVLLGAALLIRTAADLPAVDAAAWLDGAAVPAVGSAALAAVLAVAAAVVRRRTARRRADTVRRAGRQVLRSVVDTRLADPTHDLLTEHRQVRELAASAVMDGSDAGATPAAGAPTPGRVVPTPSTR